MIDLSITRFLQQLYCNKDLVIVGMGREGLSSFQILRKALPNQHIIIYDDVVTNQLDAVVTETLAADDHSTYFSKHDSQVVPLSGNSVIFKSPGISHSHALITRAIAAQTDITSNTALFFDLIKQLPTPPITIGITGTKGKSTTTSLITHVLQAARKNTLLAGNIGVPPLSVIENLSASATTEQIIIVLELSSHQLLDLHSSPDIAVIQNITPEHLDYYTDFEQYQNAKSAIAKYQNEKNVIIYCPIFPSSAKLAAQSSAAHRYTFAIDPQDPSAFTAYVANNGIFYKNEKILDVAQVPLVGKHNLLNVLPSILVGKHFEVPNETIAQAILTFTALPHRLEYVTTLNGTRYFNDSQATTPEAAIAALQSFAINSILLLAGGSDKGVDLTQFVKEILLRKVKMVLLFSPVGEIIAEQLKEQATKLGTQLPKIIPVSSMTEAVEQAAAASQPNEIVLLSPACASFGLFKNYQDRGDQFKAAALSQAS